MRLNEIEEKARELDWKHQTAKQKKKKKKKYPCIQKRDITLSDFEIKKKDM